MAEKMMQNNVLFEAGHMYAAGVNWVGYTTRFVEHKQ
jgi:hypothetical protein